MSKQKSKKFLNQKGQGLIEYLIIVALVAVATMGVVRVVGANVSVQFARVNQALGGKAVDHMNEHNVSKDMVKKKDLSNFLEGARNESKD